MKYAFNSMQVLIFGLMKLSVLLFYRRVFRGKVFDLFSKLMIAIIGIWTISFVCAYLFACGSNFWALWSTLDVFVTRCANDNLIYKTMSISDVTTDIIILSIPLPIVCHLFSQLDLLLI